MKIESGVMDEVNKLKGKVEKWFGAFQKFLNGMEGKEAIYIVVPEQDVEGATYFYVKLVPSEEQPEDQDIGLVDVDIELPGGNEVDSFDNQEGTDENLKKLIEEYMAKNKRNLEKFGAYNLYMSGYEKIDDKPLKDYSISDEITDDIDIHEVKSTKEAPELPDAADAKDPERFINKDNTSSSVKITLKKVVSDEETNIDLVAINCSYSPVKAMIDVEELLSDDEFVDSIPEEETSYELISDEDSIEVNPCEELVVDPCEGRNYILKSMVETKYFLEYINNNYKGNNRSSVSELIFSLTLDIDFMISEMVKVMYVDCCEVPFIPDLLKDSFIDKDILDGSECGESCMMNKVMNAIQFKLTELFDIISTYYCNEVTSQSKYDQWLNTIRNNLSIVYHNISEDSNGLQDI